MKFKLHCVNLDQPSERAVFIYDNETGLLRNSDGLAVGTPTDDLLDYVPAFKANHAADPIRKHNAPRVLKIQMGLSCNYSCGYCLQKYVPRAETHSAGLISSFVEKVQDHLTGEPENIQFWGGEPLVYIKTLKPLVAALKGLFPTSRFTMITNGSLLDLETNDWIMANGIGISLSHDGPGQKYRGPDPFDDPAKASAILDLYHRKKAAGDPVSV